MGEEAELRLALLDVEDVGVSVHRLCRGEGEEGGGEERRREEQGGEEKRREGEMGLPYGNHMGIIGKSRVSVLK